MLDHQKARAFNCQDCNASLQRLRNCLGRYSAAKNILNGKVYEECPQGISKKSYAARWVTELYFECKESKIYPCSGSLLRQTEYTHQLFRFLDNMVMEFQGKQEDRAKRDREREKRDLESKTKRKK